MNAHVMSMVSLMEMNIRPNKKKLWRIIPISFMMKAARMPMTLMLMNDGESGERGMTTQNG